MPRIRTVKPEFFTSEAVAGWHPITRLAFMGLLVHAEDNGVGPANERLLASLLFPMDDRDEAIEWTRRALDECSRGGQIAVYEACGRRLYAVANWAEHQRIDRPSNTRYPRPTDAQIAESFADSNALTSDDEPALTLVEPSTSPRRGLVSGREGKGREEEGKGKNPPAAARPAVQLPITAEVAEVVSAEVRSDVEALCSRLHDKLVENDYKPLPKITDAWRREARLILDKDERNLDQALKLITWALENEFWSTNIASMGKFRFQYPKLLAAAKREHAAQQPRVAPPTVRSQRLAATAAMMAKFKAEEEAERNGAALPGFERRAIQA